MFWLIENNEQLNNLSRLGYEEAFIEVVGKDHIKHPLENSISLIYIHPLLSVKGYIIALDHSEGFYLDIDDVRKVLSKYKTLYTIDKKNTFHYSGLKNLWDVMLPPSSYDVKTTITHEWYYRTYKGNNDLNCIIPLSKHYEYLNTLFYDIKAKCVVSDTKYAKFFNNKTSMVFAFIESSGIKVDKETFQDFFHEIDEDIVHTRYNLKTTTTRPGNSFQGVNFAALNKSNGCRKSFIPRNKALVEFDFSAYHPTLIAKLINFDFGGVDIHQSFAEMYGVDYETSKQLTFKQLYGNVSPEYEHLEFFVKLKKFIADTWRRFKDEGYYECPISGYRFLDNKLDNMNPPKLLNYILQQTETSNNVVLIWKIIGMIMGMKTKLVLYTYDSILLDYHPEDEDLINNIKKLFKNEKLQYKISYGKNYNFK